MNRNLVSLSSSLIFFFTCCSDKDSARTQQLSFSHDAPLELYCFVDERLSVTTKDSLCAMTDELVLDLTFIIREGRLDSIRLFGYVFDEKGNWINRVKKFRELSVILSQLKKEDLLPFRKTQYGDFGIRLETRRFCRKIYFDM